jgi:2,3-bisphosphoglycerate-independent phosphoglycerate mutase
LVTNDKNVKLQPGILADVAPTILHRMGISVPAEMTGKNLTETR